jgi:GMP synthase (glutamine-hydrolysing)
MLLLVNNISSYFDDLQECLRKIDSRYVVKRYDELDGFSVSNCDGIILSGRTGVVKEMNISNMQILRSAYREDKPLLGICYGAEITALAFNGSLSRLGERIVGDNEVMIRNHNLLTAKKSLNVFESHGFQIARLPDEFRCIADSRNCKYEMIEHEKKRIFGTQFHPEVSKDGVEILRNFSHLTKN